MIIFFLKMTRIISMMIFLLYYSLKWLFRIYSSKHFIYELKLIPIIFYEWSIIYLWNLYVIKVLHCELPQLLSSCIMSLFCEHNWNTDLIILADHEMGVFFVCIYGMMRLLYKLTCLLTFKAVNLKWHYSSSNWFSIHWPV